MFGGGEIGRTKDTHTQMERTKREKGRIGEIKRRI